MNKIKKHGFTLAEILITLSIIGVVAALTIPTLIQRTGNEELVSRLMKAYSTLSQATEAIMTEQGAPTVWAASVDNMYNAYKEKLRVSKACGSGAGCWKHVSGAGTAKYLNGADYTADYENEYEKGRKFILSDGASVMILNVNKVDNCGLNLLDGREAKNVCGEFVVDVNGAKKPNQWGRDIFGFVLKKDGLYPEGIDETDSAYKKSCNVSDNSSGYRGWGCAARVIAEGDMNY